jgi:hypothetical protein
MQEVSLLHKSRHRRVSNYVGVCVHDNKGMVVGSVWALLTWCSGATLALQRIAGRPPILAFAPQELVGISNELLSQLPNETVLQLGAPPH